MEIKKLFGIVMLLLCTFSFISCNDDDEKQLNELTPQELYQTSWRGTAFCEAWEQVERGVGIQFIDETNASISWNNSEEPFTQNCTYSVEGKYITFYKALQLDEAPWSVVSFDRHRMVLKQHLNSANEKYIVTLELNKVD
jgi:hypothetical protein